MLPQEIVQVLSIVRCIVTPCMHCMTGCVIVGIMKLLPSQHLAVSSWSHKPDPTNPNVDHSQSGPPRGLGRPRANTKSGPPKNGLCKGGLGAHPQEILHALKCVLGTPEALFRACTQYIYSRRFN